jgi:hypothetical protein
MNGRLPLRGDVVRTIAMDECARAFRILDESGVLLAVGARHADLPRNPFTLLDSYRLLVSDGRSDH